MALALNHGGGKKSNLSSLSKTAYSVIATKGNVFQPCLHTETQQMGLAFSFLGSLSIQNHVPVEGSVR